MASASLTTALPTGTYKLDAAHTIVGFETRHMMFNKVRGVFKEFDGSFVIGEDPTTSSAEGVITVASLDSGVADRDAHLKSPDFFNVAEYPEMTFRSLSVAPAANGHWTVSGELTIRGTTRPVSLDVEYLGSPGKDFQGNERIALSATAEIDREDWGMTWNVALEAGRRLVSKKVKLEIETEGVLQAS